MYALQVLPLGIHSILFNLSPFFTLITTFILLKERLPDLEILNMIMSFLGVVLVIFGSESAFKS